MHRRRVTAAAIAAVTVLGVSAATAPAQAVGHAPVIRTMSVHTGGIRGQHALYITGDYLLHAKGVFFGSTAAKQFRAHGSHRLTVVIPTHLGGIVDVRVLSPDGTSRAVMASRYRYVPSPVVSSARPTSGPVAGGTRVTVRGANFREVVGVSFGNSVGTSIRSVSPTEVTVLAPAHEFGTVDVRVRTSFGRSATRQVALFDYLAPPTLSTRYLPPALAGRPYVAQLVASDDAGTWAVTAGSLPVGLTLSGDTISGTPRLANDANSLVSRFTVSYTDSVGQRATRALTITTVSNHWVATVLPLPPDAATNPESRLDGLTCPAPGSCVAAGFYQDAAGVTQRLLASLSSGRWTVVEEERPNVSTRWDGGPTAVSCAQAGYCVVTHSAGTTNGELAVLATLSGNTWDIQPAPTDGNSTITTLNAADCVTVNHCVAVGSDSRGGLIDVQNADGGWRAADDPTGDIAATGVVTAVSCSSDGICRAVGDRTHRSLHLFSRRDPTVCGVVPDYPPWTPVSSRRVWKPSRVRARRPASRSAGRTTLIVSPADCWRC